MTKLTWLINEEPIPNSYVVRASRQLAVPHYPPLAIDDDSSEGETFESANETSLAIKFLLNPKHSLDGLIKLRCTASSIPDLYTRSAEVVAQVRPLREASLSGRYSSGQSQSCADGRHAAHQRRDLFRDEPPVTPDAHSHNLSLASLLLSHRLDRSRDQQSFVPPLPLRQLDLRRKACTLRRMIMLWLNPRASDSLQTLSLRG